jgi:hypothetical protein
MGMDATMVAEAWAIADRSIAAAALRKLRVIIDLDEVVGGNNTERSKDENNASRLNGCGER